MQFRLTLLHALSDSLLAHYSFLPDLHCPRFEASMRGFVHITLAGFLPRRTRHAAVLLSQIAVAVELACQVLNSRPVIL